MCGTTILAHNKVDVSRLSLCTVCSKGQYFYDFYGRRFWRVTLALVSGCFGVCDCEIGSATTDEWAIESKSQQGLVSQCALLPLPEASL